MDVGSLPMNTARLITKLVEIGKAARQDASVIHPLLIEAENYALELQRDILALLRENERLRLPSPR